MNTLARELASLSGAVENELKSIEKQEYKGQPIFNLVYEERPDTRDLVNSLSRKDRNACTPELVKEFRQAVLSFVAIAVVFFGALVGVMAGVVVSLITQYYRSRATGHEKLLGFESDGPDIAPRIPDNMIVDYLHGFLSFTNIDRQLEEVRKQITDDIDTVIFEISDVTSIDATAAETLRRFMSMLSDQGVCVRIVRSLALANDHYTRYELRRIMKRINVYPTVQSAIDDVNRRKRKQLLKVPLDYDDEE